MPEIRVEQLTPEAFRVQVTQGEIRRVHLVSATAADVERLSAGLSGEELVEESFRFVLEREPIGVIPDTFHLLLFARYHPDYLEEIPERMRRRSGPLG